MNDSNTPRKKTIGALLFPEFELLDIFGPLEMFGVLGDDFEIVTIAETTEPVASAQGPRSVIDRCFDDTTEVDVLLVPGGRGTRVEVENPQLLDYLRTLYPRLDYLASICTGSGLLAAAGLLDGFVLLELSGSMAIPVIRGTPTAAHSSATSISR